LKEQKVTVKGNVKPDAVLQNLIIGYCGEFPEY